MDSISRGKMSTIMAWLGHNIARDYKISPTDGKTTLFQSGRELWDSAHSRPGNNIIIAKAHNDRSPFKG